MRSELLLIEKIEQYLEGTLDPVEHATFEKQIAADIELQKEVALQKEIVKGLQRSILKKDVAVAFLKYKKLALLFKLGMIGATAIVGTAVTVAVIHYTNKNNNTNITADNRFAKTAPIDSISKSDTTPISTTLLLNPSDSITENPSSIESYNHVNPFTENKSNGSNTSETNLLTTIPTPTVPLATVNSNKTTDDQKLKDSVIAAPPLKENKKDNRIKDTRLPNLFWAEGTPITWLGIDFSNARLLGKFSEITNTLSKDSAKTANKYFKAWNALIISEKKKYNFNDALYNKHVLYDLDYMNKRNDTIQAQRLFVANTQNLNHLNPNVIQKIVNSYSLGKEGLGLAFIVESFDKLKEKSAVWVTIIDMETNEVLLTEKMTANPGGGGLTNYWARSFYNTIVDIETKKFQEWKKAYKK